MKTLKLLGLLMMMLLIVTACQSKEIEVNMSTGGAGGTYYPIGGAIAQIISDNLENVTVNAQIGNASIANINLLQEGKVDTALLQNNVSFWAYEGTNAFEGDAVEGIRGIASLYTEAIQVLVPKELEISRINDLKGLRVNLGQEGSGMYFDALNILAAFGMVEGDIKASHMSSSDAAEALKDGELDATFVTAGFPTSSIIEVQLSKDVCLLSFGQETLDDLRKMTPYYGKTVIPANTYLDMEYEVTIPTVKAIWAVREDMDVDLVYKMTKAFWENLEDMKGIHDVSKEIILENALSEIGIPLHEGALKYYREVGLK